MLTETAAHETRWAHVLSSSIGGTQTAPVVTHFEQVWGNTYLLCSDGLNKHVSDDKICERLNDKAIQFYEKSLEINPANNNAVDMLKKIRGGGM